MKKLLTSIALLSFSALQLLAQEVHHDSTLKNVVRINITPILITSRPESLTMGYERLLKKNQTISANIGHLKVPVFITSAEGEPVQWINNLRNTGFISSVDYRFYFKRNKYSKPDGLYWGPYLTYYYIDNKAGVELYQNNVVAASAEVQFYANMLMAGVQLGYQFVIGNRWTIDMILLGPGVGYYKFTARVTGSAELEQDSAYLQGVYDALVQIYPGAAQLFEDHQLNDQGTTSFGGAGFRYVFQVGYRF